MFYASAEVRDALAHLALDLLHLALDLFLLVRHDVPPFTSATRPRRTVRAYLGDSFVSTDPMRSRTFAWTSRSQWLRSAVSSFASRTSAARSAASVVAAWRSRIAAVLAS